jgi:OOP family OmpA-OmpF porin
MTAAQSGKLLHFPFKKMIMKNMNKIALAVALMCSTGAFAQTVDYNPSWYVAPSINMMRIDSDFGQNQESGDGVGLRFGKALLPSLDIQIGSTYSKYSNDHGYKYTQTTLGADALWMMSRSNFRPFILAGLGEERSHLSALTDVSKSSPYVNVGLGLQATLSDQFAFQVDVRRVRAFQRDGTFSPQHRTDNTYTNIGLVYYFGATPSPAPVARVEPTPEPVVVPPPAPTPPAPRFERITLKSTELFAFDSATLNMPQPKLDEIANALNADKSSSNIGIYGYTDRLGSDKYNQALSQRRADSVKAYLVGKGVASSRLSAEGKGESNPVVQCNQKKRAALIDCLEPNRRVEMEQITVSVQVK